MITYVILKNFMSFDDVLFDFRDGKKVKPIISIYGENGSGKSNFVYCMDFIKKSIMSFEFAGATQYLNQGQFPEQVLSDLLEVTNFKYYIDKCRMIGSSEDTYIEVGFKVNGHTGHYIVKFSDTIKYEHLYYFGGKQNGVLFDIEEKDSSVSYVFNKNVFKTKEASNNVTSLINQYWGKHTLLSIFFDERRKKNEQYIIDSYLEYIYDFIDLFANSKISINLTSNKPVFSVMHENSSLGLPPVLDQGIIAESNEYQLDKAEDLLRILLTQLYSDVVDVYYTRVKNENGIKYELHLLKRIAGDCKDIPFDKESEGTKKIVRISKYLFASMTGNLVIIDEIDNGIHDLLLKGLLSSISDYIDGQLIITTHNTVLMEMLSPKSVYVIDSDYRGNKTIKCLQEFGIKHTNNPRSMYIKGLFGGIPLSEYVDFDEISMELNGDMEES